MAASTALENLRKRALPTSHHTPSDGWNVADRLGDTPIGRRTFMGGVAGFLGVAHAEALAPRDESLSWRRDADSFAFLVGGVPRWSIRPSTFAGRPSLRVRERADALSVALRGARFLAPTRPRIFTCACTEV
jgi:hypothetical protein